MNKVFFLCLFSVIGNVACAYQPLLVVVIMVKNEETVIRATLQPFVDAGIDSFCVLDTGSTDHTVAEIQNFFSECNIEHGYVIQEPFIDFATSRNHLLDRAQEKFPHAAFIFMVDAEWYINDAAALIDYCQLCIKRGDIYPSYLIRIVNEVFGNYVCRLLRCNYGVRFAGVVHEIIMQQTNIRLPDNIFLRYLPAAIGIEASVSRFERDCDLLCKEYQKNPYDPRTLFYLARTYEALGDLEAAYVCYKKRIELIGWDEEDFIAHYRLAETIKKLIITKNDKHYSWAEAIFYYTKAYQMRPHRAEPLIAIADYYLAINCRILAYLYAYFAVKLHYPCKDLLFVENYIYDYYRYELFARCISYDKTFIRR